MQKPKGFGLGTRRRTSKERERTEIQVDDVVVVAVVVVIFVIVFVLVNEAEDRKKEGWWSITTRKKKRFCSASPACLPWPIKKKGQRVGREKAYLLGELFVAPSLFSLPNSTPGELESEGRWGREREKRQ